MSRQPRKRVSLFLFLLVSCSVVSLSAQRGSRRVFVSATDASGRPVLNLTQADLDVTENGVPREVTRVALGTAPLRIVLMVDSSTAIGPMVNTVRTALTEFVETLPPQHEVTFISSGGQLRVRTPPSTDRQKLKAEIGVFASAGGANAFLDTVIEADQRFLKTAPGQWPVLVIVTTDNGETRREMPLDQYNRFMQDFVARGGAAHAVILQGKQIGPVTDLTLNLVDNVGGLHSAINTEVSLPERLRAIAARLARDHEAMENKYEVEFTGDAKAGAALVNVITRRDGVTLEMSGRRPF